jgi:hypothetical protein
VIPHFLDTPLNCAQACRALEVLLKLRVPSRRIEAFSAIAPRLPAPVLETALDQASSIAGEGQMHQLLESTAPLLKPDVGFRQHSCQGGFFGLAPRADRLLPF